MDHFVRRCEYCLRVDRANAACPRCGYNGMRHNKTYMLAEGTQLTPRYMLGKFEGQGGFSICYRAWDKVAEKIVAIKELFLASDQCGRWPDGKVEVTRDIHAQFAAAKQGLKREADVLKKLTDEIGIVKIHDYFEANETAYLVMDLLRGLSYSAHLTKQYEQKGQLHMATATAVEVAIRLLDSLQSLHNRELLHLDVKPTNIQVIEGDRIMLLDLGSARDVFRDPYSGWNRAYSVGFSAPEQFSPDGEVTPATDVYGVAATLYFSLSLKVPTSADKRQNGERLVPLAEYNQDVPPALDRVIEKAMDLDAGRRYPSAAAFNAALRPFGPQINYPVFTKTASQQDRVIMGLIDTACGAGAAIMLDQIGHLGLEPLNWIICCLLLQIFTPLLWRGTPGMLLQGFVLQTIDRQPVKLPPLLARALLTCGTFFLLLSWDQEGTMAHDRATGTRVMPK